MEIKYSNKIVAFIDVLGFSALVYSDTTNTISKYFDYVLEEFTKELMVDFGHYLISDSIVVYTEAKKLNFTILVRTISKLQVKLITRGIIVRGGISTGELYVNPEKNIIVGKGLINAYNLEGKANFPRIIIDRSIIPLFYASCAEMIEKSAKTIVFEPPTPYMQDLPYIDYTRQLAMVMQAGKLETVKDLLTMNLYKNQNVDKYIWLKTHILISFEKQKAYIESKEEEGSTDRIRLRLLNGFIDHVKNL